MRANRQWDTQAIGDQPESTLRVRAVVVIALVALVLVVLRRAPAKMFNAGVVAIVVLATSELYGMSAAPGPVVAASAAGNWEKSSKDPSRTRRIRTLSAGSSAASRRLCSRAVACEYVNETSRPSTWTT